jgi:hypothetical protein
MNLASLKACLAAPGGLAGLAASLQEQAARPKGTQLISDAFAFVLGKTHTLPEPTALQTLERLFLDNLRVLETVVDWNIGAVRTDRARRHISSPTDHDALVGMNTVEDWPLIVAISYALLSRIKPSRKCAVVVTMRDDGITALEWIAHCRAIGFEAIFVYSNDNADRSTPLLQALSDQGVITFIENNTSGTVNPQRKAFAHSLYLLPELRDYEWVFYADSDEFLVPSARFDFRIDNVLQELERRYGQQLPSAICYHWKWFVSNYEFSWRPQPLLERFTYASGADLFKCVVRIADVISMHALHFPETVSDAFFVDSNLNVVEQSKGPTRDALWSYRTPCYSGGQINHYWCKSFEEFVLKKRRGDALIGPGVTDYKRDYDLFFTGNGPADPSASDPPAPVLLERDAAQLTQLRGLPGILELEQDIAVGFRQLLDSMGGYETMMSIYDAAAKQHAGKLVAPDHAGSWYASVLADLHEALSPQRYFEIGTLHGNTLTLAQCESLAVDPNFAIGSDVFGKKPACHLYQKTSDDFFAQYNPLQILGAAIDLAFLDGMHVYDFLLRDFMNTEKYCDRASVITMHDCIPTDIHVARHEFSDQTHAALSPHDDWWAGDVWKTLLILRKYRPDLRIFCLDAPPTGLVVVTNLDRHSRVLAENYDAAIKEFESLSLADYGVARFHAEIGLRSTASIWETGEGQKQLIPGFLP